MSLSIKWIPDLERRSADRAAPGRILVAKGPRSLSGWFGCTSATSRVIALIILAAVIPVLILAGAVGVVMANKAREDARRAAFATASSVAERVTSELAKELEVASALATSTTLDQPELASFYADALRLAASRPLWETVSLTDPHGLQVMNLLRPLGTTLEADADPETLNKAIATKTLVVGGIGPIGPISGKRLIPLRIPVTREGKLIYVLTVWLNPQSISTILAQAGAPKGWIGAILDAHGSIVARTVRENSEIGRPAAEPTREVIAHAHEGFYIGRTLEGVEVETVFRTLAGTGGWTVHFGIPRSALNRPVERSFLLLGSVAAGSLMLAGLLSVLVARDLAQRRRIENERSDLALKLSEARGAVAVEAAELGTWRTDPERGRIFGSPRVHSLLLPGSVQAAGSLSWPWQEFLQAVHEADRDRVEAAFRRCRSEGHLIDIEFRALMPDGGGRWVRATGRALSHRDGQRSTTIHGVLADIDDKKRSEADRRELARRLADAQENERRRIARELHDQVGQTVTGLSLGLKSLERYFECGAVDAKAQVRWLSGLARDIGRDIHRASSELRPTALDDVGLQRAIAALSSDISRRHAIRIDVQDLAREPRLPAEVETTIYRAVQEALTNILKHAKARRVAIVVERRGTSILVVVEDDGCGFNPDALADDHTRETPPLGLSGIRERLSLLNGELRIESAPGCGCTLFMEVPYAVGRRSRA